MVLINLIVLAMALALPAFSSDKIIISGEIVQDILPYTYQSEFTFTNKSKAVIRLIKCDRSSHPTCKKVVKKTISNINSFPIPFEIEAPKLTSSEFQYRLEVSVYSKFSVFSALRPKIGDLMNEYQIVARDNVSGLVVRATGLESCDDVNAGGFCL